MNKATQTYTPQLRKYQLKAGREKAIETQLRNTPKAKADHFGPHLVKNGKKYYYKDLTDQLVTQLWSDEKGNFDPAKCAVFEEVPAAAPAKKADK